MPPPASPTPALASSLALPRAGSAAPGQGTDYANAITTRSVAEMEMSNILGLVNPLLEMLGQTHYADNVGAGPYLAVTSLTDPSGQSGQVLSMNWIVNSQMIQPQPNGPYVNQVQAWISEGSLSHTALITITNPAVRNADGSWKDYGDWTLNSQDGNGGYLWIQAGHDASQQSMIAINLSEGGPGGGQGVMVKGTDSGYGKLAMLAPQSPQGAPSPALQIAWVYNSGQLKVETSGASGGQPQDVYKSRAATADEVTLYGLYDGTTGDDILNSQTFQVPVLVQIPAQNGQPAMSGPASYAMVGGMAGSPGSNLYSGPNSLGLPSGIQVTRQDVSTSPTYSTFSVPGTLVSWTTVPADASLLQGIPVNLQLGFSFTLSGTANNTWQISSANPPVSFQDHAMVIQQPNLSTLVTDAAGNLYAWVDAPPAGQQAGFYPAQQDPATGLFTPTPGGSYLTPAIGVKLTVALLGEVTFLYDQSRAGWRQEVVTGTDPSTGAPILAGTDYAVDPVIQGTQIATILGGNYELTFDGSAPPLQGALPTLVAPWNAQTVLPGGSVLAEPGFTSASQDSTYQLATDPTDPITFMSLVYQTVGSADQSPGKGVNQVVNRNLTLQKVSNGALQPQPLFTWSTSAAGFGAGGQQTYLATQTNGQGGFLQLGTPIQFNPVAVTSLGGTQELLSLSFDGWLEGVPAYATLDTAAGLPPAMASQILDIPSGTQLTDLGGHAYLVKQLAVSTFLETVPPGKEDGSLDISTATALDLTKLAPQPGPNGLGAAPSNPPKKYVDGKPWTGQ